MSSSPEELLAAWRREEQAPDVVAAQRSFGHPGTPGGARVLLIHGGGGSPEDFRELGAELAAAGAAVLCPLLPAHGRGEAALGDLVFQDLIERALSAFDALAADGAPVVVIGQSMGAALGVQVCVDRDAAGFAALAPAFRPFVVRRLGVVLMLAVLRPVAARRIFRWQTAARRGIRAAAARIPELRCPLLVLHSRDDASVSVRGARELLRRSGSVDKRLELLDGQGHVLSLAPDRRRCVFPWLSDFVATTTAAARTRTSGPRP